jgi:hypothetical protein
VEQVLRSLLADTRSRSLALARAVSERDVHDLVTPLAVKAVRTLLEVAKEAESILADPGLAEALLYPEFFQTQRRLAERQMYLEAELVPLVMTFDNRDARMTEAARRMTSAVGYESDRLVIKAQANGAPYTVPAFRAIWVPPSDVDSAFGWPDILHELGHIVLAEHPDVLDGFGSEVAKLLDQQVQDLRGRQAPEETIERTRLAYAGWTIWAREFAADLLATWFLGPAYPWANLRLCARFHRDVYRPSLEDVRAGMHSHPADHARMLLCVEMCRRLSSNDEAGRALDAWNAYLSARQLTEPQGFASCYPIELQNLLLRLIEQAARSLGLVAFTSANDVVRQLQRLYWMFATDAQEVRGAQDALHSHLGL